MNFQKICVLGLGYIGLPTASTFATNGVKVVGVDVNPHVLDTLRSGNMCGNVESQLQVVNIKDLKNPFLVKSYPMVNPFGLGIDEGTLFICDGTDGLKIYDAKNVQDISSKLLVHYKNLQAFDIIPYQKVAMMIATDGLYQYDYSDIKNIRELSKLTIAKP